MTTALAPAPAVTVDHSFTFGDYCDRCDGAAHAMVKVEMPSGSHLLFCGHHYKRYEENLTAQGAKVVHDIRETLTVKRESSGAMSA